MTPTQRSLALLTKQGYTARVTEHWNHYAKIRQDLFGFIDIVALHPDAKGLLGIQTTSYANLQARVKKIFGTSVARLWLDCGNRIDVHGWDKRAGRWECAILTITKDDKGNVFAYPS